VNGNIVFAGIAFVAGLLVFLLMLIQLYHAECRTAQLQRRVDTLEQDVANWMGIVLQDDPRAFAEADLKNEKEVK
jgi:hypothetical protein